MASSLPFAAEGRELFSCYSIRSFQKLKKDKIKDLLNRVRVPDSCLQ